MDGQRQPHLAQTATFTPASHARAMTLPMAPAIACEVALAYHLILETLRRGHGNGFHFSSMAQVTIKTMLLGKRSYLKLGERLFREAQEGIVYCRRTGQRTGVGALDHSTYKALAEILALFDRQLAITPFYEYMLANESLKEMITRRRSEGQREKV
jgi:hypothetical protein